jgi:hypothetical protein
LTNVKSCARSGCHRPDRQRQSNDEHGRKRRGPTRAADDFATIKTRMEELRHRRRAADDFITIRARMEELRRERDRGQASEGELRSNPLARRHRTER